MVVNPENLVGKTLQDVVSYEVTDIMSLEDYEIFHPPHWVERVRRGTEGFRRVPHCQCAS
jgi:hypothetical protein